METTQYDILQFPPDPVPTDEKYFFPSLGKFEQRDELDEEIKKILQEIESLAVKNNLEIWYHFSKAEKPDDILQSGLNTIGQDITSTARLLSPSELMSQRIFRFQAIHPNVPIEKAQSLVIFLLPRRKSRTVKDWYLGGNLDDDKSTEYLEHVNNYTYRLPGKYVYGYWEKGSKQFVRNGNFLG